MPASTSINLLDQPEFESSSIGRLLTWAITYGRYIMIGTEIIVLLAFISRFSLDRRLTDLRDEVSQKQIILVANAQFEQDFTQLQLSLTKIRSLLSTQNKPTTLFDQIATLLPADVRFRSFVYRGNTVDLNVNAGTTEGLSLFLSRLQKLKGLNNIEVNSIEKNILTGTDVQLSAKVN